MKLHCQLTADDYIRARFLHMRPRPVLKWLGILVVAAAVVTQALLWLLPGTHRPEMTPLLVQLGLVVYLLLRLLVWLPWRTRTAFKQQKSLQEPYDVEISEDLYHATSAHGTCAVPWRDFHNYKVGPTLILVYQSDALFHMFPKRWFADGEFAEFQQILARNLGKPRP